MLSRLLIIVTFVLLLTSNPALAAVVISSDFNDQAQTRSDWRFYRTVRFRSGQAAESGQALAVGPGSYFYHTIRQPRKPESMKVTFWFRVGKNSFSSSPGRSARFQLYWLGFGVSGGWYTVQVHRGASGAGNIRSVTINIPPNRFAKDNYILFYNSGNSGYYHIDNVVVTNNESQQLDRFNIANTATNASVCKPHEVVIEARDSANQLLTDFDGRVDISTSTGRGNWSMPNGNNRFSTGAVDSGQASYQFNSSDNGRLRLHLRNEYAQSLTVNVRESSGSVSSVSSTVRFSENAFVVEYDDSLADDVIAYRNHGLKISMIKRDGDGQCGVAQGYNRSGLFVRKQALAGDPNGLNPQLVLSGSATVISNSFSSHPISFQQGVASFRMLGRDVGRFRLDVEDRSNSFSDSHISGASPDLSVRPFAFNIVASGSSNNLTSNAPVFRKAGENFTVAVSAVGWQPSDDTNNDGVADGHSDSNPLNNANLSNNNVLAAFGAESPGYGVTLSSRSLAPLNLNHQDLSGTVNPRVFNNGQATAELAYSNAGIMEIELSLEQANYLSGSTEAARKIVGRSGAVGRFIPSHFSIGNTNLEPFCRAGSLTHLGQPFSISSEVSARGRDGRVLDGYQQDFAKLSDVFGQRIYQAKPLGSLALANRVEAVDETLLFNDGEANLSATLRVLKTSEKEAPLKDVQVVMRLVDGDGVTIEESSLNIDISGDGTAEHSLLGASDFYYSRLFSEGRHGPETSSLSLPFEVQSWRGHSFTRNTQDSCSLLKREHIRFTGTGALNVPANLTVPIASANTLASFTDLQSQHIRFEQGSAGLLFSAPGFNNRGEVEIAVDYSELPWLSYDWNQNSLNDDTRLPNFLAKFGAVRGHDRIVYWRESN